MSMNTPLIELRNATKRFPKTGGGIHTAIRDVNLQVQAGEFVALVGPTGCGKSTALSLISGLQPASVGETLVRGKVVEGIPDGIGYMFQTDATLPWLTVVENVASGPRYRGIGKAEARENARDWVNRVGLAKFEGYYPHQLSGGMRKRVALAQTLVNNPEIILMDEPFSALDVQTRQLMQAELLRLWSESESDSAVIFVTHDLEESIVLADRVVVMTASPASIKADFAVGLSRPRDVEEVRLTPEFLDIYRQVWDSLREEVEVARAAVAVAG